MTDPPGGDGEDAPGPVAIGALGGSGTRVYARVLQELDFWIGDWVNGALDNLLFTALVRDPAIVGDLTAGDLAARAGTLARYLGGKVPTLGDLRALLPIFVRESPGSLRRLLPGGRPGGRWGWKEPNTQLFVAPLAASIDGLRYLHVLRHGLDMAFSPNQNQLNNFGHQFGLRVPDDPKRLPEVQLDYWIRSTRAALDAAERLLPDRHLVSRFDDLCADPERELARVLPFLGAEANPANVAHHLPLVEVPASLGRYRDEDLSRFRPDQLDAVEALGFAID